jgi:hypothetical protein
VPFFGLGVALLGVGAAVEIGLELPSLSVFHNDRLSGGSRRSRCSNNGSSISFC